MLGCQISTFLSDDAIELHGTIAAMPCSHTLLPLPSQVLLRFCTPEATCNQHVLMAGSLVDLPRCFACPGTGS